MTSRIQDAVTLYLRQKGYDTSHLRYEGNDHVIIGSRTLSGDIYENIIELQPDKSWKIIAKSDLPQSIMKLGVKRATKWKDL